MKQNQLLSRATERSPLQCHPRLSNASPSKARLLLVEDHDVNQILIQAMTKRLGYETELASDGAEAVAQITRSIACGYPFDLVLMDIQMPFMDGYEATRIIRASGLSADILPIIAITANAFGEDIRNCLNAGMQAHISKPVDISNLEAALGNWLKPKTLAADRPKTREAPSDLSDDLVRRYRMRREEAIACVVRLADKSALSDREVRDIRDLLHKLAGTAAMFGERELGNHAKLLEVSLQYWKSVDRTEAIKTALENFLEAA